MLRAVEPADLDRVSAHIDALQRVGALRRRLRAASTVGALFADATDLICRDLRFTRGLIVSVQDGELRTDTIDALRNPASDRLRRAVLAAPVALRPDASEAELIRLMRTSQSFHVASSSVLADALGLRRYGLAPIVVESRTLAILVVDRDAPELDALDTATISAFAEVIAAALEHVVLRARQRELATDMQNLTLSTQALMREMLEAPVTLPSSDGHVEAFPLAGPVSTDSIRIRQRLSEGEARIAALLVQGRSNRAIAEELILSPETVKANVARILRKLGVSNRVAAATVIMQLSQAA
ncbi:MAG TPA: LuxR C-terminal-related transcriptional regulator [Solirubrobacteraceae bacterium]|jgi:DNA-binding CsgD family transcriptional regulator|nr:LuxR C-terminal-related transcriptional regulator [Solirubrobacteraceae bacterium]